MRRLAVSTVTVLALVLGACGGDDDDAAPEDDRTGATTTTTAAAADEDRSCDAADYDPDELEPAMPTELTPEAAGFELQPDDVGDTGPSDFDKAVADESLPDPEKYLAKVRFLRGYQRLWVGPGDTELIVFLYEFCDETGAEQYVEDSREQMAEDPEAADVLQGFDVSGLPEAEGISGAFEGEFFVLVNQQVGPFVPYVIVVGDEAAMDLGTAQAIGAATAADVVARVEPLLPTGDV